MGKKGFVGAVKGKNDDIRKLVEGEVPDVPKEVKEELVKKLAEDNSGVDNKGTSKTKGDLNSGDQFYKSGGGSNLDDFMTPHSEKHTFNPNVKSTKKATQFGENIDVAKLREDTMLNPDSIVYNTDQNVIIYKKEYDFNISTSDTPTGSHRVYINLDPKPGKTNRNSQFPYYGGDK
jgi:hypothetical protein